MQARIARVGEIVVVHLGGRVDVETAEPFRKACNEFLLKEKVVFDFQSLSFVGSSGILPFLETMQAFAVKCASRFKFSGMGSEFKKVFAATSLSTIETYDTHQQAVQAFLVPPAPVSVAPAVVAPQSQAGQFAANHLANGAVEAAPQVGATAASGNAAASPAASHVTSQVSAQPTSQSGSGQLSPSTISQMASAQKRQEPSADEV